MLLVIVCYLCSTFDEAQEKNMGKHFFKNVLEDPLILASQYMFQIFDLYSTGRK